MTNKTILFQKVFLVASFRIPRREMLAIARKLSGEYEATKQRCPDCGSPRRDLEDPKPEHEMKSTRSKTSAESIYSKTCSVQTPENICGLCGMERSRHFGPREFCDDTGWLDGSGVPHGPTFTRYHDDGSIIGEQA